MEHFEIQLTTQERRTGAGFAALHRYSTQICNITDLPLV